MENVTSCKDCIHRNYEKKRIRKLSQLLEEVDDWNESLVSQNIRDLMEKMQCSVTAANNNLANTNSRSNDLWNDVYKLKCECDLMSSLLDKCLPKLKSRIHEFTDGGPGVSVSNSDVKIRIGEIVLITNAGIYSCFFSLLISFLVLSYRK